MFLKQLTHSRMRSAISRQLTLLGLGALWLLISSCTTVSVQNAPANLDSKAAWVLLPIINHTATPQAGLRAEAILESLVRAQGVGDLRKYPARLNSESLFEPVERSAVDEALKWARKEQAVYALTGTVDEWRYKVGVDGEPAVGITLQLINMANGRVIWSATGSKTGWSREALSAVAQKLITTLTAPLSSPAAASNPGAGA